jgi:HAMP domain-containing protein
MTAFSQMKQADGTLVEFEPTSPAPSPPAKRPSRWSPSNWPVRWKVLAIALVPLILAATFGGLRISSGVSEASRLRSAADRAELVPEIAQYMDALRGAVVTATEGGDVPPAMATYDERKAALRQRLDATDVIPDVRQATDTLLDSGQDLVNQTTSNTIDLRQRVAAFVPLLLTAETAITGSVRGDSDDVRLQAGALSRAIGAQGQMSMQQMLVKAGDQLPEPELRQRMVTIAGTEPSTITGMAELLGASSDAADTLRSEMLRRMTLMSDPATVLVANPELLQSEQVTAKIADQLVADTASAIPAAVAQQADAARTAAIRDAILIGVALIVVLVLVLLVARSLIRPLRTLRDGALRVAHQDLAAELEQVRAGRAHHRGGRSGRARRRRTARAGGAAGRRAGPAAAAGVRHVRDAVAA